MENLMKHFLDSTVHFTTVNPFNNCKESLSIKWCLTKGKELDPGFVKFEKSYTIKMRRQINFGLRFFCIS